MRDQNWSSRGIRACVVVALAAWALTGCPRSEPASEPVAEPPAAVTTRVATAPPAPAAKPAVASAPGPQAAPAEAASAPTLASAPGAPPAPLLAAGPLGYSGPDGLQLQVDPEWDLLLVWDGEARLAGGALERARTIGSDGPGLFGLGWRAACEARLYAARGCDDLVLVRPDGAQVFAPATPVGERRAYVSRVGAVEWLLATPSGYSVEDPAGRTWSFDRAGLLIEVSPGFRVERTPERLRLRGARPGDEVELLLDAAGRVFAARGPGGFATSYRYDEQGRLIEVRGSRARRYGHDAQGRLATVADGLRERLKLGWDAAGELVELTADGERRRYAQEGTADAEVLRCTGPAGEITFRRQPDGWSIEDGSGTERVWFDLRLRVVARQGRGGVRVEARFDPLGRAVPTVTLPDGTPARVETDAAGRVLAFEAAGVRQSFARDHDGRLVATTDPEGRTTTYGYDAAGRAHTETGPAGTTRREHDADGRLVRVVTPAGRAWSFSWDGAHLVGADGPMGPIEYLVDDAGRRLRRRDATGRAWRYAYDAEGRIEALAAEGGATTRFRYGEDGRLRSVITSAGEGLAFRYDAQGRRIEERARGAGLDQRIEIRHEGELEERRTPFGDVVFSRERGRVVRLDSEAGAFTFAFDEAGRRVATTFPSGAVARSELDPLGQTTALTVRREGEARALLELRVAYGADHRPAAVTRDGETTRIGYDAAGRLSAAEGPHVSQRFEYDADGNRVREVERGAVREGALDARGRLVRRGDERLEYDAAGRLIARTRAGREVARYAYDAWGRLVAVRRGGRTIRYTYDPLERIATRSVDGALTRYVYDADRLLAEVGPNGRERVYVYGPGRDEPLAYRDRGRGRERDTWTYLHADALGTVLAYSDAAGRRVDRVAFTPFGELARGPRDPDRPLFYAGRLVDREAGLVSMRARFYVPELGRFLDPDPAGLAGGLNAYVYVENRPLEATDPSGLWPSWDEVKSTARVAGGWALDSLASHAALLKQRAAQAVEIAPYAAANPRQTLMAVIDAEDQLLDAFSGTLVRAGVLEPERGSGPYGSEWTAINLVRPAASKAFFALRDSTQGGLAVLRDAVDGDGKVEVADAFAQGYQDQAVALWEGAKAAHARAQARSAELADTLDRAGHSPASMVGHVAAKLLLDATGGSAAWSAAHGYDVEELIERGERRDLSDLERFGKASEAFLGVTGVASGVGRVTRRARLIARHGILEQVLGITTPGRVQLARGPFRARALREAAKEASSAGRRAAAAQAGRRLLKEADDLGDLADDARAAARDAASAAREADHATPAAQAAMPARDARGIAGALRGDEAGRARSVGRPRAPSDEASDALPASHPRPDTPSRRAAEELDDPEGTGHVAFDRDGNPRRVADLEDDLDEDLDDGVGHFNLAKLARESEGRAASTTGRAARPPVDRNGSTGRAARPPADRNGSTGRAARPASGSEAPRRTGRPRSVLGEPNREQVAVDVTEKDLAAVNRRAHHPDGLPDDRKVNCTHCALATDSLLAGRPASALPARRAANGKFRRVGMRYMAEQLGAPLEAVKDIRNVRALRRELLAMRNGRALVGGVRAGGQPGHVFNVVVRDGRITFYDGQTGRIFRSLDPSLRQFERFRVLRTDTLERAGPAVVEEAAAAAQ